MSNFKMSRIELADIPVPNLSLVTSQYHNTPYVPYGCTNDFPQDMLNLSTAGITHPSCLKLINLAIAGEGYQPLANPAANNFLMSLDYETSNSSLLEKMASSLAIFEGLALEVIWNRGGDKIAQVNILPLGHLRAEWPDRYGNVANYYYNNNWLGYSTNYEVIPAFNPQLVMSEGVVVQPKQILYLSLPNEMSNVYPLPVYAAASNYIAAERELGKHSLSSIVNGFIPSSLITFVGNPTEEQERNNKRMFEQSFTGAEKSGKIIINYIEDIDHKMFIDTLTSGKAVDEYINLEQSAKNNIATIHGVNMALLGITDGSATLFSNGEELKAAWHQFQSVKIRSYQKLIEKTMNIILKYAGFTLDKYVIIPYNPTGEVEIAPITN